MRSVIFHPTLCLFRIQSEALSPVMCFPHVHAVSLIHCSRKGVSNVLTPERFPNLKTVQYLSAHPGQADIHRRFSKKIEWIFPHRNYAFYDCMMEAGLGRIDPQLLHRYLYQLRLHPYKARLNLPGYGICDGEQYRSQMIRFLQKACIQPIIHYTTPYGNYDNSLSAYMNERKERDYFKMIMDDCEAEEKI